jgi:hypothetical protein
MTTEETNGGRAEENGTGRLFLIHRQATRLGIHATPPRPTWKTGPLTGGPRFRFEAWDRECFATRTCCTRWSINFCHSANDCVAGVVDAAAKPSVSKGVVFLGIHTADGELDQISDLKKLHSWKTVTDIDQGKEITDGATAARYSVSGYPTLIVIDGSGKIAFNSAIPPSSVEEFTKEMQRFAKALNIPWPPSEKDDQETIAQVNRVFAAKISQEIDKALAASKSAK